MFDVPLLKIFSKIGAVTMLLAGLVVVGITIFRYIINNVYMNDIHDRHIFQTSLITLCCLLVIAGVVGIFAVVKRMRYLLIVYQIFLTVFFIAFIILGVGAIIYPNKVFPSTCNDSNFLVNQAYNVYKKAQSTLCQSSCYCDITPWAFAWYSEYDQSILATYKIDMVDGVNLTQACSSFNTWSESEQNTAWVLQSVQKYFGCSSWCQGDGDNLFHYFSNVDRGRPNGYCFTRIQYYFNKYSNFIGISSFVIAGILLVILICNFALFCHPDNKQKQGRDKLQEEYEIGTTMTQQQYQE